ncbi:bifunctional DNA primase/polymerase [Pseudoclavibacter helvolus]|uniref:Primase-polymerase (Primpol)-like protein n=1 Tax=Pseudoclavibacter helvolus TaxID=255205 RepID=A0A7W4ULX2_9MICO|nr:DNA primase [Pseudoclavibacter helvolus]MBB2956798.1 primase-polymerase (primpol)-like protein [Pseudoclavibacter helvolus]
METKRCAECGTTMVTVRADAKFCTTKCRVYHHRNRAKLPAELTEQPRWVRWKPVLRRGKVTKVPLRLDGSAASSTDASTWSSHADAAGATTGSGVGFVLGLGIGCIDLDHCLDGDVVAPWAQRILDANPSTYVEVSVSGTGLHVFGLLEEAPGRKIRDGRNVEVYSRGRYIVVTGQRHGSAPRTLAPLVVPSK